MIQILMSTYNGEKYLETQIESLLKQTYKNIKILIRDDGSLDRTKEILEIYTKKYPEKIECIYGENLGVIESFFELINNADEKYNYFAFCDQDDFWLEEKVEKAILAIEKNRADMYFSNKVLVDENLRILKKEEHNYRISLENSLVENLATGCTVVFNQKMFELIKNKEINFKNILMHDWFIFIVANIFGEIYFDKNSYIYYRQHSNNVVGIEANLIKKNYKRIKRFLKNRENDTLSLQILEILKIYSEEMDKDKLIAIEEIINTKGIFKRYKILKKRKILRQSLIDNIIFKILYLVGWM